MMHSPAKKRKCKEQKKAINLKKDQDDTKKPSRGLSKPSSSTWKPIAPYVAGSKLTSSFFDQPALDLAKALLGQYIVRVLDGNKKVVGRIVETEAYLGVVDQACHCYGGKKTAKTAPMFMPPGTAYVYHVYFSYFCFNISSRGTSHGLCQFILLSNAGEPLSPRILTVLISINVSLPLESSVYRYGEGQVVCIRAMEPVHGEDVMRALRGAKKDDNGTSIKDKDLCNGPAKVCQAFCIDKEGVNEKNLTDWTGMWLELGRPLEETDIVMCKRIGLDNQPTEWQLKPWRFYVRHSSCVSYIDKTAEAVSKVT